MTSVLFRDPLVRVAIAASVLLALPLATPILSRPALETYVALWLHVPLLLISLTALARRAWTRRGEADAPLWKLLALGFGCWLGVRVADLVAWDSLFWTTGFGLTIDGLYVGYYTLVLLALETPLERAGAPGPRARAVGMAGTVAFVTALLVYFSVVPNLLRPATYQTWVPSAVLFAVLDAYVVARLVGEYRRAGTQVWRDVYLWLLLAFTLWTALDALEAVEHLGVVSVTSPGDWTDVLWFAPHFALLVAARKPLPQASTDAGRAVSGETRRPWGGSLLLSALALPLLHVGLHLTGALDPTLEPARELVVFFALPVLALLAMVYERIQQRERIAAERERLERSDRARLAQRMDAVGRLAGGIAHDFNNLLQIIRICDDSLLDDLEPRSASHRYAREIGLAADRAAQLTDRLLTIGRRRSIDPRPTDLNATVEHVLPIIRRSLDATVTVRVQLDPDAGNVLFDRDLLEHVIMNLGFNARDAMPDGGTLAITTERTDPQHPDEGSFVQLCVADTGIGISDEAKAKIFEPFFTTKDQSQAAGLGLSLIYGAVCQSGGMIDVDSALGAGSRFRVLLPAARSEAPALARANPEDAPLHSAKILVVEDEPGVRSVICRLLEEGGFRVLQAENGVEALDVLAKIQDPPELILTDLLMPDMGGLELAERVKRLYPRVGLLLMTGHAGESEPLEQTECAPLLRKPFTRDELAVHLRQLLRERAGVAVEL